MPTSGPSRGANGVGRESVPFFTVTESARDLTQHFVDAKVDLPWDAVEDSMQIQDVPLQARTDTPTKLLQVYVDDVCHAATQSTESLHIPTIRRAAIHGIHALFPPPGDHTAHGRQGAHLAKEARARGWKFQDSQGNDWLHF